MSQNEEKDDDFDPLVVDIPRLLGLLGIDAEHRYDRWVALCPSPNHQDTRPSWDIKDEPGQSKHGLHHCLACKWQGTATDLVMALVDITEQGARDWIKARCMGQPPIYTDVKTDFVEQGKRFKLPEGAIVDPLHEWPANVREWLLGRSVTPEQVTKWGMGYAITGRLNGRIVIPVRDARGTLLNYTARTYIDNPRKYLEPKMEEGATDTVVFGEQYWPERDCRDVVVVTEGAFNAMAVERVIRPTTQMTIGSLFGSNVKLEHVMKLGTFTGAIILTDPDLAGDRAAERIMRALQRHVRMARVNLPRGKDANDLEPTELRRAIATAWRDLKSTEVKK